ncbi:CAAX amino terminal protease family [Acidisarcina polymorpha]|uniref:CAAX amino terminal protease family n=1 Tax=Acidisarcina polymorpha TaxID=2211140 RepID=A0A2Z5G2I1_9BACT|nr:CPBP family intramembrane glutamic endopeptidase [Acidisarcina polymorpha]AXC13413.1 CAAX amino terminal protease family [Acidisarcina polymorpha]
MLDPVSQTDWNLGTNLPPDQGGQPELEPILNRYAEEFAGPPLSRFEDIPGLVHTCLFFILAILILFAGELATVAIGHQLPPFRHESYLSLASDARLMIPAQALQYLILLGLTTVIFGAIWHHPFWKAIQWNFPAVGKRWIVLLAVGILLGLASSLASNYLPMPKEAPILNDLMHSTTGAWLMFVFGTTCAPLIEELAFRGFLLPSLTNTFRRWERSHRISHAAAAMVGIPVSILLTSAPFALLHSLQVSYAWAPVLLIGFVSIALCIVRLAMNSLAASTLVHATYNFCLFAGMLVASDGFRHLDKLNS